MARGKGRSGARKRSVRYTYVSKKQRRQIKELSPFVPNIAKLKGREKITPQEAGYLTKKAQQLRYTSSLKPITEKQEKALKASGHSDLLVGKGVRAIHLRNTSPDARMSVRKDGIFVTSNGRKYEYHPVDADPDALAREGEKLLERDDIAAIYLWTGNGRVNEGWTTEEGWTGFLYDRYTQYIHANEMTQGIAARVKS